MWYTTALITLHSLLNSWTLCAYCSSEKNPSSILCMLIKYCAFIVFEKISTLCNYLLDPVHLSTLGILGFFPQFVGLFSQIFPNFFPLFSLFSCQFAPFYPFLYYLVNYGYTNKNYTALCIYSILCIYWNLGVFHLVRFL